MSQNSQAHSSELFAQKFSGVMGYWGQVIKEIGSSIWKGKFPIIRTSLCGIAIGFFFLRGWDESLI